MSSREETVRYCPVCNVRYALNSDGTLPDHWPIELYKLRSERPMCEGSGRIPEQETPATKKGR